MPLFKVSYNPRSRLYTLKDKTRNLKIKGETVNHIITDWLNTYQNLSGCESPSYLTDQQILVKFDSLGLKMPLDILDITPLDVLFSDLASTDDPDYVNAEFRVLQVFEITQESLREMYDQSN